MLNSVGVSCPRVYSDEKFMNSCPEAVYAYHVLYSILTQQLGSTPLYIGTDCQLQVLPVGIKGQPDRDRDLSSRGPFKTAQA